MNILVLDDTVELLRYFKSILKPIPKINHISTATNVEEFLNEMHSVRQHVILVDIYMSPMSGPDILRRYKEAVGAIPIVLTSCSDDLRDIENDLLEEGFNVVQSFQKPILPLTFLEFFGND
jgi:response regulator of citrate/malate metabolism